MRPWGPFRRAERPISNKGAEVDPAAPRLGERRVHHFVAGIDARQRLAEPFGERRAQGTVGGFAALEEAVAAYRAALTEWTRERAPLDWAASQNGLGAALKSLGKPVEILRETKARLFAA